MRNTFSKKKKMNNFLKEHAYRLSQISSRGSNITIHPLRNIMDVFWEDGCHSAPWCSSLLLALNWRCQVGCCGWGSCRSRSTGPKRPHPEEKVLSSSFLGDWAQNYQVAGKHPFLCQRCVISLREIVPSEQKAMTAHYSPLAWNNPRTERPGRLQSMGSLRVGHD